MKTRIVLNGNDGNRLIGIGEAACFEYYGRFDDRELDAFIAATQGRMRFVLLSYELRHQWYSEEAYSEAFPVIRLWVPEAFFRTQGDQLLFEEGNNDPLLRELAISCTDNRTLPESERVQWKARQTRSDYLKQINGLKQEIRQGNIYEVNYCQEYYADDVPWESVLPVYNALNAVSKAPFSWWFESDRWMIASASPERFLQKTGNRLVSQPIKGTAPRATDEMADKLNREALAESRKDRMENVMIVDLVRNDLSRIAARGTVKVEELFGIYSFPTVHQMISTVSCELRAGVTFAEILRATFPMGSMTGAPKVAAMELADRTERFRRGLYSGSVGYLTPDNDFDLNVVIRSLIVDRRRQSASCGVGGAITMLSEAGGEYEECLVKVGKILKTVGECPW